MILSRLGTIDIETIEEGAAIAAIKDHLKGLDLIIVSQNAVGDKVKELFDVFEAGFKRATVPCVIFSQGGNKNIWEGFAKFKNVAIIGRPFFPEDLLNVVKGFWGVK